MMMLSNRQARQFILLKHGLLGEYKFIGKQGVLEFVRQMGCIQYDPIDICGKNSELVCRSRVKGFTKNMLDELLYTDRKLLDYVDKNLSIIPVEDFPYFNRYKQAALLQEVDYPEMAALKEQMREYIDKNGAVCSNDIKLDGNFYWRSAIHWSGGNNLSRSVLEQMYSTGELVIHHKKGTRKYYDIAAKYIAHELLNAPEPIPNELEYQKWRVLRRIGAVGLLWNRPSDAWINIWGLKATGRKEAFEQLLKEGKIIEITVEDMKDKLYCRSEDGFLLEMVIQNPELKPRCELIAPLDNFLWDRKLIKTLFKFDYKWEIYTPIIKRKYGHYVLPILNGENFIGRVEAVVDKKTNELNILNIWLEDGVKQTKKLQSALMDCFERFARFHNAELSSYITNNVFP